jgi:hypothetical protein
MEHMCEHGESVVDCHACFNRLLEKLIQEQREEEALEEREREERAMKNLISATEQHDSGASTPVRDIEHDPADLQEVFDALQALANS